jgi:hypothetical protein
MRHKKMKAYFVTHETPKLEKIHNDHVNMTISLIETQVC